jgi:hypothetical protein
LERRRTSPAASIAPGGLSAIRNLLRRGVKQVIDLTIAISLMNSYNRMAISFRNTPQGVLEN